MSRKFTTANELAVAMIEGDESAMLQFWKNYNPKFRQRFLMAGYAQDEAEQLATTFCSDIILKVLAGKYKSGKRANFNGWLNTCFYRFLNSEFRKRPITTEIDDNMIDDREYQQPESREKRYQRILLKKAIRILPPSYKEIVKLKLANYSYTEIENIIGISSNLAKVRFKRAKDKLKKIIKQLQERS